MTVPDACPNVISSYRLCAIISIAFSLRQFFINQTYLLFPMRLSLALASFLKKLVRIIQTFVPKPSASRLYYSTFILAFPSLLSSVSESQLKPGIPRSCRKY
jgi:hypothetical protein